MSEMKITLTASQAFVMGFTSQMLGSPVSFSTNVLAWHHKSMHKVGNAETDGIPYAALLNLDDNVLMIHSAMPEVKYFAIMGHAKTHGVDVYEI